MYISVEDLKFLIQLENKLGEKESWSKDVMRLWELNEKLIRQRGAANEKIRKAIAARRKIDKNYARSKGKSGGN